MKIQFCNVNEGNTMAWKIKISVLLSSPSRSIRQLDKEYASDKKLLYYLKSRTPCYYYALLNTLPNPPHGTDSLTTYLNSFYII